MLTETVSLHDNFQFEAKLGLPFSGSGRQSTHGVETYFFVPSSLCINPGTLTRDEFFRRLKNYIQIGRAHV